MCIQYDETKIPGGEANARLLHYDALANPPDWYDVTSSLDRIANIVCGEVKHLSPFVIAVSTATAVGGAPVPSEFALHGNVPNPFNPITTIAFDIPEGGADVSLVIYDVAGRLVRTLVNEHRAPGTWSVQWNGDDEHGARVASGVYFYRMRAGSFVDTKKMVLLK